MPGLEVVLVTLPILHLCEIITCLPLRKETWEIGQRRKDNTDFGEHQQSLIRNRGYDFRCVSRDGCYKLISEIEARHLIFTHSRWLVAVDGVGIQDSKLSWSLKGGNGTGGSFLCNVVMEE